jgi:hypothetical protein
VRSQSPKLTLTHLVLVAVVAAACGADTGSTASTSVAIPDETATTEANGSGTALGSTSTTTSTVGLPGDLLVIGDWGSGTLPQGAVAGAMMRYYDTNEVSAIATTGDNLLSDDWEFLMKPYGWATQADIPFWVTWGDRDVETETRTAAVNSAFDKPPRWTVHDWGSVKLVILDTTQADSEEQAGFLRDALAADNEPSIVLLHHPIDICSSQRESPSDIAELARLFDDDVFLVLSGHESNYQRYEADGLTYVVTGGGGGSLSEISGCDPEDLQLITGESVHHFLALEQGEEIFGVAVDVNGEAIDEFAIPLP